MLLNCIMLTDIVLAATRWYILKLKLTHRIQFRRDFRPIAPLDFRGLSNGKAWDGEDRIYEMEGERKGKGMERHGSSSIVAYF